MKSYKDDLIELDDFPKSWTDPVSGTHYPRQFLASLSEEEAQEIGWYEVVDNQPVLLNNEKMNPLPLVFENDSIVKNYTVTTLHTAEELAAIAVATLTEKINVLADQLTEIIDTECKKTVYFHGLGFADGMSSVSKYPTNVDAMKLTAWAEACWVKAAEIQAAVIAQTRDIDSVNIADELPDVVSF